MNNNKNLRANSIVTTINSFPTLPSVVSTVMEITADPMSDVVDLMHVIELDQSLTASVLKLANSALYGVSRNVSSLKEALTVLGFAEIQKIVLSKAVFESFKHLSGDARFRFKRFWEHSFYCGITSKIISRQVGAMYNEMFVAGIIHDIGKLILFIALEGEYVKILNYAEETQKDIYGIENEILGTNHSKVAMDLLKRWMFPENLLKAVGYHHIPFSAGEENSFSLIVSIADSLSHVFARRFYDEPVERYESVLLSESMRKKADFIGLEWNSRSIERYFDMIRELRERDIEFLNIFIS